MKSFILTSLLFCFSQISFLYSQQLPTLECRTLAGMESNFPSFRSNELKVILITLDSKNQKVAESWVNPLVQKFIRRSGMMDMMFEARLYSLSCLSNEEYLKLNAADKSIIKDFPEELKEVSFFSKASSKELKTKIGGKSSVKVIVVREDNELLGFVEGEFTEEKMEVLEELITEF